MAQKRERIKNLDESANLPRSGLLKILFLFAVYLLIFSCSTSPTPSTTSSPSIPIGPKGGEVSSADNTLKMQIPPGAIDKEVEITVNALSDDGLPENGISGTFFEFGPTGLTFAKPVLVTIALPKDTLVKSDSSWVRLVEVKSDGSFGATQLLTAPTSSQKLTAGITHFSKYCLVNLNTSRAIQNTVQTPITDIDVLFLIDNSNSMAEEQANLATNFPKLIQKLDEGGLNYRVGVVTSDLGAGSYPKLPSCEKIEGDKGKLVPMPQKPECPQMQDAWIEKIKGKTNVPGDDISQAFACLAQVGVGGCGFEHQLEAIYKALDPNVNPGFLRRDAALALIIISDEDDCSAEDTSLFDPSNQALDGPLGPLTSFRCFEFGTHCNINDRTQTGVRSNCVPEGKYLYPISRYVDKIKKLKSQILVSAITGPTNRVEVGLGSEGYPQLKPSCQSDNGKADPAIRVQSFVDAFGSRGTMHNICDSDFGPAMDKLGGLMVTQTALSWCLPYSVTDTNPLTKEVEADCVVLDKNNRTIPSCSAESDKTACFRVFDSPACALSQVLIQVENASAAEIGEELQLNCLTLDQ